MTEMSSPVLDLQERKGPILQLDSTPPRNSLSDSGTSLAVGVITSLALVAALVLVPLSRQATISDSSHRNILAGLIEAVQLALASLGIETESPEIRNDAQPETATTGSKSAPEAAPLPANAVDPFASPLLAALKDQRCFNFMPAGDNPAAVKAFSELVWNKLEPNVRALIEARLDVCSPFETVGEGIIKAGGCRKNECGENDAHFYINSDGKMAIDYRVAGECKDAAEVGFTNAALLCKP
jgi:hypothetical protein